MCSISMSFSTRHESLGNQDRSFGRKAGSFTATVTDETRRWTEQSEAFVGWPGGWWFVAVRQCEAQFVLHPSHQPVGGLV